MRTYILSLGIRVEREEAQCQLGKGGSHSSPNKEISIHQVPSQRGPAAKENDRKIVNNIKRHFLRGLSKLYLGMGTFEIISDAIQY